MVRAQVGGGLLLVGSVLAAVLLAIAASGQGVGLGGEEVQGGIVTATLALLGAGTAVVGTSGSTPFDARSTRTGLAILAIGLLSIVLGGVATSFTGGESSWFILFVLGGIPTSVLGSLVTGASLVRSTGGTRLVGLFLLAGVVLGPIGSLFGLGPIGPILVQLGVVGLVVGLAGVGWLAVGGRPGLEGLTRRELSGARRS